MATLNVFITNLSAYAAGELRGEWLGLPTSKEERKAAWERIGAPEEVFFYGLRGRGRAGDRKQTWRV